MAAKALVFPCIAAYIHQHENRIEVILPIQSTHDFQTLHHSHYTIVLNGYELVLHQIPLER